MIMKLITLTVHKNETNRKGEKKMHYTTLSAEWVTHLKLVSHTCYSKCASPTPTIFSFVKWFPVVS